jgi:hypothetical protein
MWQYPKSPLHQAAIDKMKPERDREAAQAIRRARAAETKLHREQEAGAALKEHQVKRLATLAKTARLRAARLAQVADALLAERRR